MSIDSSRVIRSAGSAGRVPAARRSTRPVGHRLGDPLADVALPAGPGRAEQVEADAAGDGGQPGAGRLDGLLLLPGQGVPAGVGLLDDVLGVGERAEQPVGDVDQLSAARALPRVARIR